MNKKVLGTTLVLLTVAILASEDDGTVPLASVFRVSFLSSIAGLIHSLDPFISLREQLLMIIPTAQVTIKNDLYQAGACFLQSHPYIKQFLWNQ